MKFTIFPCVAMLLGSLAACGSSGSKCDSVTCNAGQTCDANTGSCVNSDPCAAVTCTGGQTCDSTSGMCANPPAPSLNGAQIDRIGRPGVNTALTNPFDAYKPGGQTELGDATKDRYNADSVFPTWATSWAPPIKQSLGYFDGLDNISGNQTAYGALFVPNYGLMSQLLAGDALQVDTSKSTCTTYLAAETAALGGASTDCGGRKLNYDVIDITFTTLVSGGASVVSDGIGQTTTPSATFPFFTNPI